MTDTLLLLLIVLNLLQGELLKSNNHIPTSILFYCRILLKLGVHDRRYKINCLPGTEKCSPPLQEFNFNIRDLKKYVITHRLYVKRHHDIALLRLPRPADITASNVQPICLPIGDVNLNVERKLLVVSGWGKTEKGWY